MSKPYILENESEFERLEHQSRQPEYDFHKELENFTVPPRGVVLDAGCGSGIVTRYLADRFPQATIMGCDSSAQRVEQTRAACADYSNITIQQADLLQLVKSPGLRNEMFDGIVCRYVLHHLCEKAQAAVAGLAACLKPGGTLCLVDGDGIFVNLYPRSDEMIKVFDEIRARGLVDFNLARKLPFFMHHAGLRDIRVQAEAISFTGEALEREAELVAGRLDNAAPVITEILGGDIEFRRFKKDYLRSMKAPGSFYFHNILVARAVKA